MTIFVSLKELGTLYLDKILFEGQYPILFTCINSQKDVFLCVNFQRNESESIWLISKISPMTIIVQ